MFKHYLNNIFTFKDSFKKKYNILTSETCKQIYIGKTERILS